MNLENFEKKVNEYAVELALNDTSLLRKRGDLLALARQKVADSGYVFKKRDITIGSIAPTPKRHDKVMRDDRMKSPTSPE